MGKKKGKKAGLSGDVASNDVEDLDALAAQIDGVNQAPALKSSKKQKKKKEDDNWEDDVLNEIAELSIPDREKMEMTGDEKPSNGPVEKEAVFPEKNGVKEVNEIADCKAIEEVEFFEPDNDIQKKKKKNSKPVKADAASDEDAEVAEDGQTVTVKTKAQKQAEKKERERKKKELQRLEKQRQKEKKQSSQVEAPNDDVDEAASNIAVSHQPDTEQERDETTTSKKKNKKKSKGDKEEVKSKPKGKPNKAMIKAMQEQLNKIKEEEERARIEEEEKIRQAEEAEQQRLQKLEEERLKKERKKQKEKDRIKRLKQEGKYLTPAQKEAQRKREAYLESLKSQGLLPTERDPSEKPKKVTYDDRKKRKKQPEVIEPPPPEQDVVPIVVEEIKQEDQQKESEEVKEEDNVIDDWEAISDADEEVKSKPNEVPKKPDQATEPDVDDEQEEDEEGNSYVESEESSEQSDSEDLTPRQRVQRRIEKRKFSNEEKRCEDDLRSPVICVMGHVDTGKTKILDKIRHSNVQDGEAGGITQQIGATCVPVEVIREQTMMVKAFQEFEILFPGLLVIDTPGHESFSNLRSRGSSVCDMAILVVDIMHGLESQTLESISMLKKRKTPFIVALNKIDRLYEWKRGPDSDVVNTIKKQKRHVKDEFDERVNDIIVQFATQNLNVKLFYENDDPKEWISLVPTSAHSGDGMGNLIALVVQLCQTMLRKRLAYSEELQCTVLEVKAIQGLGTTVDVILTNGRLKYGDTIVLAGVEGPIVTHIKGLLMPQPLKELRVKNPYNKYNDLKAAQGVKILAKDLDKALAGTQMLVACNDDEIEILKAEVQSEVEKTLKGIKLQERGVFVQASTLGSLEALVAFLKQSKIPYAGISIGPVHKKDIMKASVMLEHDNQWAVILAFDVKVEREAQDLADNLGVKIFTADIIYHLFDAFMQHRENLRKQKQEEFRSVAVFPSKIRIMPNCVFKSRDPIVVGVSVDAGQLRTNTPLCIPSREFLMVGYVTSMEFNHKPVEVARTGQEVCIKIEGQPGEPPKMVGRHFEETDILVSKISRDSINALKDWFREDMQKSDWQLTIELKKLFDIM